MFFGAVCLDRKTLAELIKQLSPTLRVLIKRRRVEDNGQAARQNNRHGAGAGSKSLRRICG
ncbi:hypothetical protein CGL52_14455 [Pyrobaculum aerophilum]|uniref:Uncharacterized protein n=1 Tax=Pyrobaculum aerophilum TaxID=13773 RepID=A0A371QW75_9CREN|nr:hypothetical protein CGL52_14455 [Pyrobaculum aerophilum]